MIIDFEECAVVLSSRAHQHYGQLNNITDMTYHAQMNGANEFSFTVHKATNTNLWDKIDDLKLIWVSELNEYFQIEVSLIDGLEDVKKVVATSECEAELGQTILYNIEINTEIDIEREAYKEPTIFYNPQNPQASLLHRVLEKAPHYSIGHVDSSIANLQRTFSCDGTDIYSFLTDTVAKEINCLFTFDTVNRRVNAYDLYTVCRECGHRAEHFEECPECGSTNLQYYGEDTTILISVDNLTDEITYSTNVDQIKNCFRLQAGDDDMTTAIINCNPNGSAYMYYFSQEQLADMPPELVRKLNSYNELLKHYESDYKKLSEDIYNTLDKILYYKSGMMPTIEDYTVTAATEAAKLTEQNLNPISLTYLNEHTTVDTVNSALKNYATVFVKTGYVKLEVENGVYDSTTKVWTGRFKVTSYADKEDVAYSKDLRIDVNNDYENYIRVRIMKNIKDDDNDYIYDVLSITDLAKFKHALTYYSYNRLESFADATQGAFDVLVEEKQCYTDSLYYDTFYKPYYDKLMACQQEMNVRSITIEGYEEVYDSLINQREAIQKICNFENYLGESLFKVFCAYRREDTYQNDNYISDGLTTAEIFEKATEFIENVKKEIVKSGEHQHTISANLNNLAKIPAFQPLLDKFKLGNWLRLQVEDNIYRLRLIDYEMGQNDPSSINTNFSDLTKIHNGMSDIQDILNSAQSMASSYGYYANQASNGEKAFVGIDEVNKNGLNSALINIRNRDNEEIVIDKHGLLCRAYDDVTNAYSPEQLRFVSNEIVMTDDAWETASLAIGKHEYTFYDEANKVFKTDVGYGVSAKFLNAPYIYGGQIIASVIYSDNYSPTENKGSYMDFHNGTFSLADGRIVFDGNKLTTKLQEVQDVNDRFNDYSTTEQTNRYAEDKAKEAKEEAIGFTSEQLENYPTLDVMNGAIEASAGGITTEFTEIVQQLQSEIDGNVTTWTGNEVPTLSNAPAKDWATDEVKDIHIGDIYYVNEGVEKAGYAYRFQKTGNKYEWTLLKDTDITKAIKDAKDAMDRANAVGDNLVQNYSTTTTMRSELNITAREVESTIGKYSDIYAFEKHIIKWFGYSAPTANTKYAVNDEYLDLTNGYVYKYNGSAWVHSDTLKKITSNLSTRIDQTSEAISATATNLSTNYITAIDTKNYADKVSGDARSGANSDTDGKLKNYSTTTESNQYADGKANEAKQYADGAADDAKKGAIADTDTKLKNYTTTTDMNAKFTIQADEIKQTVGKFSGIYDTTKYGNIQYFGYGTPTKTGAKADELYLDMETGKLYRYNNGWVHIDTLQTTTSRLETSIKSTSEAIELTAKNLSDNYSTTSASQKYADKVAGDARSGANEDTDKKLESYSTTDVSQKYADDIADAAKKAAIEDTQTKLQSYATNKSVQSSLKIQADQIKSMVYNYSEIYDYDGVIKYFGEGEPSNKRSNFNEPNVKDKYLDVSGGYLYEISGFYGFSDSTIIWLIYEDPLKLKSTVMQSSIEQNTKNIKLKISSDSVISAINMSPEQISISANKINLNGVVTANNHFKINLDGSMEAIAGKIGGWEIGATGISSSQSGLVSGIYGANDPSGYFLSIKQTDSAGNEYYPFRVWNNGLLEARGVKIDGDLACDGMKTLTAHNMEIQGNTLIWTIPDLLINGGEPKTYLASTIDWQQGYYAYCADRGRNAIGTSYTVWCEKGETIGFAQNTITASIPMNGCNTLSIKISTERGATTISVNGQQRKINEYVTDQILVWNNITSSYSEVSINVMMAANNLRADAVIKEVKVYDA